ncbi:superoxide dismutase [Micromonospora sp. WMMD1102]|uniref:SMP-30/gluconolactonase/LRE family protein n=1 Tax=Micromonospora sp. WMMD1102 TaxID=3016105 RepID=UPI0024155D9E|nr:superoxide dismutase [Micromonospora sp. WMMD1102]MDG4789355.1 superoxide dismutase [Micromonospora sp. WMMD1102]
MIRRRSVLTGVAALGVAAAVGTAERASAHAPGVRPRKRFPDTFDLPDGWMPEGIAIGALPFAYFGSRYDGAIYRVDLATGEGRVLGEGPGPDLPSIGLKLDGRGRLFVAGGGSGLGRIVDARSGQVLANLYFTVDSTFVNDVVLTRHAAYFTDSSNPVLYVVPTGRGAGADDVRGLPLTGDIVYAAGINANGICRTPDGRALLVVQSNTGLLFRVDPRSGVTRQVDLGGELLTNGDGLLLDGRTLYAVLNRLNTVAVLRLSPDGRSGRIVERLTDPRFDVPTAVASYGNRLYLPNARFTTPPTPETPYTAVAISKP